ncbi:hypothetical protein [Burkholderia ubonensis]|uniref:hypothetical protein n=1 Tax=Burkholderia ubonensis TaxID=101571 RepID=UPI000A5A542C|nr:hypothetical protein [Burkholderia ubonensis]
MLDPHGRIEGSNACLQEALENLVHAHPEVKSTLRSWVALEARKLDGLDFSEGLQTVIHFSFKDSATIPNERQRGRHSALNLLSGISS